MKNILITGVSRGLGYFVTKRLLEKNYFVYGLSRSINENIKLLDSYDNFKYLKFDLINIDDIESKIFKKFIDLSIPIHGVINNAAIAYDDIITNLNIEKLTKMYNVNVFAPIVITKKVIRNMLLHNIQGSLIHISSVSAHTGYKGLSMYASTKGALEAFSKNIAREWGERKIRSNCIAAGFMNSDMTNDLSIDMKDRIFKRTSLKSETLKESILETIFLLMTNEAISITGEVIHVDAGTI